MSCDVGKAKEGLENELWCRWSNEKFGEWAELIVIVIAELILQPFRHFTYVTAYSPTLPSLYLRHSSFSNPFVASPMSQLIPQPFFHFSYITCSSLTSPGEPPMVSIHLCCRSVDKGDVWWPEHIYHVMTTHCLLLGRECYRHIKKHTVNFLCAVVIFHYYIR